MTTTRLGNAHFGLLSIRTVHPTTPGLVMKVTIREPAQGAAALDVPADRSTRLAPAIAHDLARLLGSRSQAKSQ
jgi:hypothetical protein